MRVQKESALNINVAGLPDKNRCLQKVQCSTYGASHLQGCLQAILAAKLNKSTFDIPCIFVFQYVYVPYLQKRLLQCPEISAVAAWDEQIELSCLKTLK